MFRKRRGKNRTKKRDQSKATFDSLDGMARSLVTAVNIFAIGSYVQTRDKFPELESVTPEDWDFFVTVAGVFVALGSLVGRVPPDLFKEVDGMERPVVGTQWCRRNYECVGRLD